MPLRLYTGAETELSTTKPIILEGQKGIRALAGKKRWFIRGLRPVTVALWAVANKKGRILGPQIGT